MSRSTFQKALHLIDVVLTGVMITLVVLMVVSISSEILLREVVQALFLEFHGSSPDWLQEFSAPLNTASQTLLVWIGLLGSSLAYRHRAHLGVDALVRVYPRQVRVALDVLSTLAVMAFSVSVLVIGGGSVCSRAMRYDFRMPGFEQFNRAWFYAVLPLTGALLFLYSLDFLMHPRPAGEELEAAPARDQSPRAQSDEEAEA